MDIKGALQKPLFGVPAWVWGVVIAGGVVAYAYLTNGSDSGTPTTAPDAGPSYQDGGAADAGDISGVPTVTQNTVTVTTNPAWVRVVTDKLVAMGHDPLQVGNALNKALAGLTLTVQEAAIWNEAIRLFGAPPEGNPPITVDNGTTTTPPPGGGTTTPPAARYSPEYSLSVTANEKVSTFTDQVRSRSGLDVDWGLLEATNPTLAGNIHWGPSGSKDLNLRWFKSAATYKIPAVRIG